MENIKITVLGSGTVMSSFYQSFDFRNPSGHLIQYGGLNVLLDIGEGMRGRLDHIRVDYFNIDAIFISHFHPDHFTIETIIPSLLDRIIRGKKEKELTIYGPKEIRKRLEVIWDNKHYDGSFEKDVLSVFPINFIEYNNEVIDLKNGMKILPIKVEHGLMEAYALRISVGAKVVAYSGDSGICDGLLKAAQDADIFLCEAAIDTNDEVVDKTKHLAAFDAGEIARKAGVSHLILIHYKGKDDAPTMKSEVERSGFKGKIDVSLDFDSYSI